MFRLNSTTIWTARWCHRSSTDGMELLCGGPMVASKAALHGLDVVSASIITNCSAHRCIYVRRRLQVLFLFQLLSTVPAGEAQSRQWRGKMPFTRL